MKHFDSDNSNGVGDITEPTALAHGGTTKKYVKCTSEITADLWNDLILEVVNAVEASGLTLDGLDRGQLAEAIAIKAQEKVDAALADLGSKIHLYNATGNILAEATDERLESYVAGIADTFWTGQYDLVNGIVTIPSPGRYRIEGQAHFTGTSFCQLKSKVGNPVAYYSLGAWQYRSHSHQGGGNATTEISFEKDFVANDKIELWGHRSGGGTNDFFEFIVTKVG